jgi:hypothetical protein
MKSHPPPAWIVVAAALSLTAAGSALASHKVYRALDGDRVEVTTIDGKPPHSRRVVRAKDLSPAEFARFEETRSEPTIDRGKIGTKVRIIDRSGKPPFSQRVITVTEENAAEFARFEETDRDPATSNAKAGRKVRIIDRSGKPPFSQRVVTVDEENAAK